MGIKKCNIIVMQQKEKIELKEALDILWLRLKTQNKMVKLMMMKILPP